MPISFADPIYLSLLLLLPIVWLMGRRSLAGLDVIRRRMALGLRYMVVLLLVLALAEVEWKDLTRKVEVIFVVDHSRSIPESRGTLALDVINKARERMDPRNDLGKVVVFGREGLNETTLTRSMPAIKRFGSDLDRKYSNIGDGLGRALVAFEPNARGRIVLISDGNQTMGDAKAAVAKARAAGVPVDVIPVNYSYNDEVLVEKVVLPNEAKVGEPFKVRVVVNAESDTEANIHLWREGAIIETRRVTLKRGPNVEVFQLDLKEAGFFRVEAVVEPLDKRSDHLSQNNSAHNFVFARGKAQVLYVHDDADAKGLEGEHLLDALARSAIRVKRIPAVEFPLEPGDLQGFDAIILDDVSRDRFSQRQQKGIETAVGDMGLGLVMIGGTRSFGAGEWRGSPVELALPVEMDIKQEEVIPNGALVMIIHSCEMPDGNVMAIKVCKASVDSLSAKDTVGVLYYGPNGEAWQVKPVKARNKPAIKQQIHTMQVGDMPSFQPIFRMALTSLKKVDAAVKHMIIMSDGDPSPPSPALLKQCRQQRITVSTICYFAHGGAQGPSVDVMKRIANITGGKYYYLDNAADLPRIFLKESQKVARSLIVNQTFVPEQRGSSVVVKGFDGFPAVTGYVLTEAKPRAEVPLVSPEGAPILAHWTYGVGKALAYTSDAKPRWGVNWVSWDGYQTFWSQAVRWVSKDVEESMFEVSTSLKGEKGQIVLNAISGDGDLLTGLTVNARITSPGEDTPPIDVRLTQRGAGLYEGDFPVGKEGTYTVSLISTDDQGNRKHSVTTGLVVPYSEEFNKLHSDSAFMTKLAELGGGRVIASQDVIDWKVNLWDRAQLGDKVALEERWPLALALALFLFFLDVSVRRVAIDWDKLWARAAMIATRKKTSGPQTMERLRERKVKVQAARSDSLAKFHADPNADHGPIDLAGAEPAPRPRTGAQPTRTANPAPGPGEDGYTNRLLAAKRRARKGLDESGAGEHQDQENTDPDGGA